MIGYLDHALANPSMTTQVVDADEWHSNADESPLFDYSDELADAGERSFERKSAALPLLVPDLRRASDHDPVIVGIDLASLRVDAALVAQAPRGGGTIVASGLGRGPPHVLPHPRSHRRRHEREGRPHGPRSGTHQHLRLSDDERRDHL